MDTTKLERKMKEKTTIDPLTGCWLYNGTIKNGYGRIENNGFGYRVHRVSAVLYLGYVIDDETFEISHKPECPNKNCWNPAHLYIAMHTENMTDKTRVRTHCKNGHEFTPENTYLNSRDNGRMCKICTKARVNGKL
jgi:hypothetical protein